MQSIDTGVLIYFIACWQKISYVFEHVNYDVLTSANASSFNWSIVFFFLKYFLFITMLG